MQKIVSIGNKKYMIKYKLYDRWNKGAVKSNQIPQFYSQFEKKQYFTFSWNKAAQHSLHKS